MRIDAIGITKGKNGVPLPSTTLSYESGAVTVAVAEQGDQPVVLALIAAGRMHPDSGSVTLDGAPATAPLRDRVALVDAPEVSEPAPDLALATVLREELAYANRPSGRRAVEQAITDALHANRELGLTVEGDVDGDIDDRTPAQLARIPVRDVPPALRIRLLTELALSRPGVEALVLSSPDRHGGSPFVWNAIAHDLASRDVAVLVVTGAASAELLALLEPNDSLALETDA
ncbi:hypothetical protein N1031_05010 [Herbiconiux moechotypicola]|uniref:ABC transporter ATP-binding protein n=1 Tax=Herbiconiux moechotypicola TaxID=637393 RepID=A0ABN3D9X0_9MICO|nr:hypothetical protein [Herbiconiux moechotypicola]MCS5729113.1 hypothetical protein [Herbiconiux moechotypicola]